VAAIETPGVDNVTFKLIPWGIDQTFRPEVPFRLGRKGLIGKLVRNDAARRKQLIDQVRTYRETIFAREIQQTVLKPLIDKMEALLVNLGVSNAVSEIAIVRQQLRLAESAGYICAGLPDASAVYVIHQRTGECMHASNTESIPPGDAAPVNFEVYRLPFRDDNDTSDLWVFNTLGNGRSLTNQAFGRVLHASDTQVTPQGHKFLYTCPASNTDHAEEFSIVPGKSQDPVDADDEFALTGYFNLTSVRTSMGATFGEDITPGGRARVHQEPGGSTLYLY
jgi:hypothetical protein